jgi:hypothetical protein
MYINVFYISLEFVMLLTYTSQNSYILLYYNLLISSLKLL